jgi:hypothetical protein
MLNKNLVIAYRVLFAFLGFSAVVTEIATIVERGRFVPANFFSFFTIESNLIAVGILLLSALSGFAGKQSYRIAMLRGFNAFNMIVVGVVFSLLLSGLDADLTAVPWDNTVLHYIMPVVVALDWFVDRPKTQLAFKNALVWLLFPLAYVTYSLTRGPIADWYPYPFLNPAEHGYAQVFATSAILLVGATGLVWVLVKFTKQKSKM